MAEEKTIENEITEIVEKIKEIGARLVQILTRPENLDNWKEKKEKNEMIKNSNQKGIYAFFDSNEGKFLYIGQASQGAGSIGGEVWRYLKDKREFVEDADILYTLALPFLEDKETIIPVLESILIAYCKPKHNREIKYQKEE